MSRSSAPVGSPRPVRRAAIRRAQGRVALGRGVLQRAPARSSASTAAYAARRPAASKSSGAGRPAASEMTPGRAVSARISRTGEPATPRSREARGGGGTLGTAADGTGKGTSEVAASRTATARAAGGPRRRLRRWCAVLGRRPSPRSYRPTGAPGSLEAEGGARAQRRLEAAQRPRHDAASSSPRPPDRAAAAAAAASSRSAASSSRRGAEVAALAPGLELRQRGRQRDVELQGGLAQRARRRGRPGRAARAPRRPARRRGRRAARPGAPAGAAPRRAGRGGRSWRAGGRQLDGALPAALGDLLARRRTRRARPAPAPSAGVAQARVGGGDALGGARALSTATARGGLGRVVGAVQPALGRRLAVERLGVDRPSPATSSRAPGRARARPRRAAAPAQAAGAAARPACASTRTWRGSSPACARTT